MAVGKFLDFKKQFFEWDQIFLGLLIDSLNLFDKRIITFKIMFFDE